MGSTPLNMNSQKITNLADPVDSSDAVNKQTADSDIILNTATIDTLSAPTTSVNLDSHTISNLANATAATDMINTIVGDARYY